MEIRRLLAKLHPKYSTLILFNTFLKRIFVNSMRNIQKLILPKLLLLAGDVELNPGPYDAGMYYSIVVVVVVVFSKNSSQ